jgi:hypothetical protein
VPGEKEEMQMPPTYKNGGPTFLAKIIEKKLYLDAKMR